MFIKEHSDIFAVEKMCCILRVSSSGYYKWLSGVKSNRQKKTEALSLLIRQTYDKSGGIYGSPRITQALNQQKHQVCRSYVARLMKRMDLRSKTRTIFKVTTDSKHGYEVAENLLQRDFSTTGLSQKWVSDITYVRTGSGWLYLTTVIDLADRKVIGWAFSNDMTAVNTTIKALKMALLSRQVRQGLIFHSDRGAQYACNEFKECLSKKNIRQSMSRKGDCWDNAVAESFFKTLKTELIYHRRFENRDIARLEIFRYIEGFYHAKRMHSALAYKTPNEMETLLKMKKYLAA